MAEFREITQDELKMILKAHRKWVDSKGKEGEKANLYQANLYKAILSGADLSTANLDGANLQGANLRTDPLFGIIRGLTASQVKQAKNWDLAFFSNDFLEELGLPPDHNEAVKKKLADLETKKKEAATKK